MTKIQAITDGDYNNLDEFEGVFVGHDEFQETLVFNTTFGLRTYPANRTEWTPVEKFSYEA